MKHSTHSSRWAQATLSLVLATTLVAGAVPAAAFADTSVKVIMAAPTQASETVNLTGAQATGEGQPEGEATTEGTQSPAKNTNQAASGQVKTTNQSASTQATASVALAADTTTVLDNGLVFVIDNATNTAAVTGWYGTQPAQNFIVPAQIRHNAKLAEVNILGGGGAPCTVLGSEDSATQNPASAQTLALQKIQKNAPKPANPSATGQEGTLAHLPNITSLTIPESITAITSDSFTDCPQLATITVAPTNPTYASVDGVLYNKALTRVLLCPESAEGVVSLPDQTDAVPASALSYCANLSTLLVGQDNVVYTSINGNLYSKDASTLVACPGGIGQTLTLPKQTATIGPDALAGITTLKSIVVLGNITTIDPTAFNDQAKQSTTIALTGGEDYETRKAVWQSAGFKNFATPANPGDTQTPDQPGEGTQPSNPGDKPDKPTDPSTPTTPEQPETPTPTPPTAQPIAPYYPPNLATPTQASAPPLYSRGAAQPRMSTRTLSVTVPVVAPLSIDADGLVKPIPKAEIDPDKVAITSTATEPIRITKITCNEDATGAAKLLHKEADRKGTSVTVAENSAGPRDIKASMKLSPKDDPLTSWEPKDLKPAPFRVNVGATLPITFGLELPAGASLSYNADPVSLASLVFTVDSLAPVAAKLDLTSNNDFNAPIKDDILTATVTSPVSDSLTYTWYALTSSTQPLNEGTVIKTENNASSTATLQIADAQVQTNSFICCQISNDGVNRPVASQVTGKVTKSLNGYSWDALSKIAADLSTNGKGSTYYNEFHGYLLADQAAAAVDIAANRNNRKLHKLTTLTDGSTLEVRIVGINHATDIKTSDGKTAGLTFMATHCLPATAMFNSSGTNTGGWYGSPSSPTVPTNKPLRTRMQPGPDHDIWNTLPLGLKADGIIKPVKKLTNNVNGTIDKDYPGTTVTTTDDYLWLPSRSELAGDTKEFDAKIYPWTNEEGKQYEFFQNQVADNKGSTILKGINYKQNEDPSTGANDTHWWERSCYPNNPSSFVSCNTGGYPGNSRTPGYSYGVVLGFSL